MPLQVPAVPHPSTPRPAQRRRRALLAAAVGLLAVAPAAHAGTAPGGVEAGTSALAAAPAPVTATAASAGLTRATIRSAQRKLHVKADGVLGPRTRAALRRYQRRHHLKVTGRLFPATLAALDLRGRAATLARRATPPTPTPLTPRQVRVLAAIAACESGGDPTAVSATGRHRGKYQFLESTWEALGGAGDPAQAPETEQDQRAAALLVAQGTAPWPVCGRKAAA